MSSKNEENLIEENNYYACLNISKEVNLILLF